MWPAFASPVEKLLGDAAYEIPEGSHATSIELFAKFIYSVREVLSNVQCLPEESIAAQHTGDRPVYTKSKYSNSTAATITSDVLGFPQSWLLENLTELRKGDTRTVIIAVADEDRQSAEGGWRLATMEGCVMTIYPRALRKPEGLHQVSPDQIGNQGFEPWRTCLATVIIHELAHFLLHAEDLLLHRDSFLYHVPQTYIDSMFGKGNDTKKCYGYVMCMVLARIIRSDGCIYNADTTAQLTAELCLCLGHPELFFDDKVGAPRTRRLEDSEPRFFPTRWSVFRHEKCSSIETLAGYDASKEYTVVESDQNVARWKERYGDENGLPGITYGGHGQPWGHDRSTWGGPKVRSPDMKNGGWQHRSGRLAVLEEEIEVRTASRPREIDWWYSTTKEGAIQARGVPGQLLRVHLAPLTPRHIVPSGSDPTPTPARTCCFKDSVSVKCLSLGASVYRKDYAKGARACSIARSRTHSLPTASSECFRSHKANAHSH